MGTPLRRWKVAMYAFLLMLTLLLVTSTSVKADSPPSTYTAQADGLVGFGCLEPPCAPSTMATGTNGGWSFAALLPSPSNYSSQFSCDEPNCEIYEWRWSFDFDPGGSFTLTGPGGEIFTGTFNSGYGGGHFVSIPGPYSDLSLDMYFTGTWNTGLRQAGTMDLFESVYDASFTGSATVTFAPAPEPGSIVLFGSGIFGLFGLVRRKLVL
jgi:PEP-CTERM motif